MLTHVRKFARNRNKGVPRGTRVSGMETNTQGHTRAATTTRPCICTVGGSRCADSPASQAEILAESKLQPGPEAGPGDSTWSVAN